MKRLTLLLLASALALSTALTAAEDDHAYTQGPVTVMTFVRTEPGMFEEYLRYLSNTYKQVMENYKKQGIILEYGVYQARPRDPQDADLILTVKYKNMAAFDELQEHTDPIARQTFGSLGKAASASVDRGRMRRELGSEVIRQLLLK
jgi:DNA-binding Lrp family transcriptional regulator